MFFQMTDVRTISALNPTTLHPPFGAYAHGAYVPAGAEWIFTSGQLGLTPNAIIPADARSQADQCFKAIDAILAERGFRCADTVRINAYVTDRAHMAGYMAARDAWWGRGGANRLPASTLVIVSGFTRPEFKVEVEVTAARFAPPPPPVLT